MVNHFALYSYHSNTIFENFSAAAHCKYKFLPQEVRLLLKDVYPPRLLDL